MTRKKFIKQLMAKGIQRNEAEFKAMCYRCAGKSYDAAMRDFNLHHSIASGMQQFAAAMRAFTAGIMSVAEAAKALGIKLKAAAGGGGND